MSPSDATGSEGFFENLLGDLMKLLQTKGPVHWELAHQLAVGIASEGTDEPNVDPLTRIHLEELVRVADLHVTEVTGLSTSVTGKSLEVQPVNRSAWAWYTLEAWRPLLESLARSLAPGSTGAPGTTDDPAQAGDMPGATNEFGAPAGNLEDMGAGLWSRFLAGKGQAGDDIDDPAAHDLLGGWVAAVGPVLVSVQCGAAIGHLAQRALGQYDLPVPRPPSEKLLLVPANIASFAEDWSLPAEDVELWVCLREVAHHAVLGLTHVHKRIYGLLQAYASGFEPRMVNLEDSLGHFDISDPGTIESALGDPAILLGEARSPAQRSTMNQISTAVAVVEGYVDYVVAQTSQRLIGSAGPLSEAMQRRRIDGKQGEALAERLFGLRLDNALIERGASFIKGVLDRAGEGGLALLWSSSSNFPTEAEVDAPGLWLERISLPLD